MKTPRERLRREVTAAIYGADWKTDPIIVTAHRPDVEAIMKEIDTYLDQVMRGIVPEKKWQSLPLSPHIAWNQCIDQIWQRYRKLKNE